MPPLERLCALEIECRRPRQEARSPAETSTLHTSYAPQAGEEPLLGGLGSVTATDIERPADWLMASDDARDVLAARAALTRLLKSWPFDP
jgi:hypothetical protein